MFERGIRESNVRLLIEAGEVIAEYPEETPLPSCLILGYVDEVPLHVVVAVDRAGGTCYVMTAYVPDPKVWHSDTKTRRSP